MDATLIRPLPRALPRRPPPVPPVGAVTAGATDPNDAEKHALLEAELALRDGAETENGCDWPEGPLSPGGCLW